MYVILLLKMMYGGFLLNQFLLGANVKLKRNVLITGNS